MQKAEYFIDVFTTLSSNCYAASLRKQLTDFSRKLLLEKWCIIDV